jgi:hypothetical protein
MLLSFFSLKMTRPPVRKLSDFRIVPKPAISKRPPDKQQILDSFKKWLPPAGTNASMPGRRLH